MCLLKISRKSMGGDEERQKTLGLKCRLRLNPRPFKVSLSTEALPLPELEPTVLISPETPTPTAPLQGGSKGKKRVGL